MGCKEREIEHFESLFYELYPRLCALADHYLNESKVKISFKKLS